MIRCAAATAALALASSVAVAQTSPPSGLLKPGALPGAPLPSAPKSTAPKPAAAAPPAARSPAATPGSGQSRNLGSVTLLSHRNGGIADDYGTTLIGTVKNAASVTSLEATITPGNRVEKPEVNTTSGQFAVRLFDENVTAGQKSTISLLITFADGTTETQTVTLNGRTINGGMEQVFGRLSFGATPAMYATVRDTRFEAWIEQQLNPETIADTAFKAMSLDEKLIDTAPNQSTLLSQYVSWRVGYAAYSEKQLLEVMTQFWMNHFWMVDDGQSDFTGFVENTRMFRDLAFGNFRALLGAASKNAMMLRYLDNDANSKKGFNINYARELLELHTVGVNGGYTLDDINSVAKIFSGWDAKQVADLRPGIAQFDFFFDENKHDTTDKLVPFLNKTVTGRTGQDGVKEGDELLDDLAKHPKTREFICGKLINMFVVDGTPPQNFMDSCTKTWAATDGDMRSVVRSILMDPAFRTVAAYQREKVKTPFEYMVGYIRNFAISPAAGKEIDFFNQARLVMTRSGMDFTKFPVPTGFAEDGMAWVSTASLNAKFREVVVYVNQTTAIVNHNYAGLISGSGMDTASGMAAYMLALTTADRFQSDEYDALVSELKGTDGIYDPKTRDESQAVNRAIGLITTLPSFQLQ